MKLLVMSDSHGELKLAEKALKKHIEEIEMVIHLGDYFRDAQKLQEKYPQVKYEYVYGNSDFMIGDISPEKIIEIGNKKILITHGHRYSVKWGYEKIHTKAQVTGVDLFLFGHTHIAEYKYCGRYTILNPGSISASRGQQDESYAIVDIKEDKIDVNILTIT